MITGGDKILNFSRTSGAFPARALHRLCSLSKFSGLGFEAWLQRFGVCPPKAHQCSPFRLISQCTLPYIRTARIEEPLTVNLDPPQCHHSLITDGVSSLRLKTNMVSRKLPRTLPTCKCTQHPLTSHRPPCILFSDNTSLHEATRRNATTVAARHPRQIPRDSL